MVPPFEPIAQVTLKELTVKTLFFVAITSARRLSKIGALSANPNLCVFHKDWVVLHPNPSFILKINTLFHREQGIILPSFCSQQQLAEEKKWHCLDAEELSAFIWTEPNHSAQRILFSLVFRVIRRAKGCLLEHWPLG